MTKLKTHSCPLGRENFPGSANKNEEELAARRKKINRNEKKRNGKKELPPKYCPFSKKTISFDAHTRS